MTLAARLRTTHVPLTIAIAALMTATLLVLPHTAHAELASLPVPPAGGLTQGVAGTSDPAALVASQSYSVEAVSMLDPTTQQWLTYIPGAPSQVNSLKAGALQADSIVTIRRTGTATATTASAPVAGSASPSGAGKGFPAPPTGGLVSGLAGTNDPATLAAAQSFSVEAIAALDVPSQTWLVYVPGAPAFASTLRTGMITANSVVTIRRTSPVAAAPAPAPAPSVASDVDLVGEATMLQLMNQTRAAAGLPPVVADAAMTAVARAHSRDMIARKFFDHTNPSGLDPFDRMKAAGISFGYAGENIATANSATDAENMFLNSPHHLENIVDSHYRRVGIGIIKGGKMPVSVTQNFAD